MKAITAQDTTAETALVAAIRSFMTTWNSTKSADLGRVLDEQTARKIMLRRLMAMDRRGARKITEYA
jgi:hypothetical protein